MDKVVVAYINLGNILGCLLKYCSICNHVGLSGIFRSRIASGITSLGIKAMARFCALNNTIQFLARMLLNMIGSKVL